MPRRSIGLTFDLVEHIHRHGFKRLLLAVSGGLDSICLAHYFIENREVLGIEWLGIAHVHHGLREGTADRDAKFVEEFAKSHNVPFFLKRLDGEALKVAEGSLEENARDARYKALIEFVKNIVTLEPAGDRTHEKDFMDPIASARLQDDTTLVSRLSSLVSHTPIAIVTAHHANDQAETMLMRIKRGTTLAGLRGIQETRVIQDDKREMPDQVGHDKAEKNFLPPTSYFLLKIYRPFLNVTRAELLAYASKNNLTWCEDESNADVKFARNKIRHELLPNLERQCPGATKQLCHIAELADRAYAKVMEKCSRSFDFAQDDTTSFPFNTAQDDKPLVSRLPAKRSLVLNTPYPKATEGCDPIPHTSISLNKKKLNKILREHAKAELSELFRLWLSELGFRFPTGFFYAPKEPAHIKIPIRASYRKRSIVKIRHTVWICEFKDTESALKFVSCEMKEKGLYE